MNTELVNFLIKNVKYESMNNILKTINERYSDDNNLDYGFVIRKFIYDGYNHDKPINTLDLEAPLEFFTRPTEATVTNSLFSMQYGFNSDSVYTLFSDKELAYRLAELDKAATVDILISNSIGYKYIIPSKDLIPKDGEKPIIDYSDMCFRISHITESNYIDSYFAVCNRKCAGIKSIKDIVVADKMTKDSLMEYILNSNYNVADHITYYVIVYRGINNTVLTRLQEVKGEVETKVSIELV